MKLKFLVVATLLRLGFQQYVLNEPRWISCFAPQQPGHGLCCLGANCTSLTLLFLILPHAQKKKKNPPYPHSEAPLSFSPPSFTQRHGICTAEENVS